jgi:hypothetical protein
VVGPLEAGCSTVSGQAQPISRPMDDDTPKRRQVWVETSGGHHISAWSSPAAAVVRAGRAIWRWPATVGADCLGEQASRAPSSG